MSARGTEAAYAAGWRLVRMLPEPIAAAAFARSADIVTRRGGRGVTQLTANLRQVVGPDLPDVEFARLVRAGMRSYMRYYLEAFRLPTRSREYLLKHFRLDNAQLLADAMAAGTGAVAALPHAGNYDMAGAWVAARGWKITTVAERLRPEGLYQRFVAFRERIGMEILPTTGGVRPPIDVLTERLREGTFVALLADRDLSRRGVPVTFFGAPTRMPAGPALLAIRTGAPLFTVDMWYEPEGPRARLRGPLQLPTEGPLDVRVRRVTQMVADGLALGIAEHPVDWHMLQRLWLPERTPSAGTADGVAPAARSGSASDDVLGPAPDQAGTVGGDPASTAGPVGSAG